MRVGEGLKTFGALKMLFNVKSVSFGMTRDMFEGVLVPTVTHEAESWGMSMRATS